MNESLLSPLQLEVDPNVQAVGTQEKEIETLHNSFASFVDKVQKLEPQKKTLETKWKLLQQQQMVQNSLDSTLESCINTLGPQLDTVAQEKLEVERGDVQGLAEEIEDRAAMENAPVLSSKAVDEVYVNKAELESRLQGRA